MSLMSNILAFPLRPVVQPLRRPAALVRAAVAAKLDGVRRDEVEARLRTAHG